MEKSIFYLHWPHAHQHILYTELMRTKELQVQIYGRNPVPCQSKQKLKEMQKMHLELVSVSFFLILQYEISLSKEAS